MSRVQKNRLDTWAWTLGLVILSCACSARAAEAIAPKSGVPVIDWLTYIFAASPVIGLSILLIWAALDQRKQMMKRNETLEADNKALHEQVAQLAVRATSVEVELRLILAQAVENSKEGLRPDFSHTQKIREAPDVS